jgi:hypothetical protein
VADPTPDLATMTQGKCACPEDNPVRHRYIAFGNGRPRWHRTDNNGALWSVTDARYCSECASELHRKGKLAGWAGPPQEAYVIALHEVCDAQRLNVEGDRQRAMDETCQDWYEVDDTPTRVRFYLRFAVPRAQWRREKEAHPHV